MSLRMASSDNVQGQDSKWVQSHLGLSREMPGGTVSCLSVKLLCSPGNRLSRDIGNWGWDKEWEVVHINAGSNLGINLHITPELCNKLEHHRCWPGMRTDHSSTPEPDVLSPPLLQDEATFPFRRSLHEHHFWNVFP